MQWAANFEAALADDALSASICVGEAFERAFLSHGARCLRHRADAHSKEEIRMRSVGDAGERAQ